MSIVDQGVKVRALIEEALAQHEAGRLDAAEATYKEALSVLPDNVAAKLNLGVLTAALGKHELAIEYFNSIILTQPNYEMAYFNRAVSLIALGKTVEAIANLNYVCKLDPSHYKAHRALGFLHLSHSRRGEAMDHWAQTYELRRGDIRTGIGNHSLNKSSRGKLLHDAEQFRFLASVSRERQKFELLALGYETAAKEASNDIFSVSDALAESLGEDYNKAINIRSAPEIPGGAVEARPDYDQIMRSFYLDQKGIAWFDDLLTPKALMALQRYLLESTIWHDFSHIGGFVASYLEDGLACPLVLQIADELRHVFPDILGHHPLCQAWAFKGIDGNAAIEAHVDDADVSVNFWITPNDGNLDAATGGLEICRDPPPASWAIKDYNLDKSRAHSYLEQRADSNIIIPYCENRAVIFDSHIPHRSHRPQFINDYKYHRINITLLFGRHNK